MDYALKMMETRFEWDTALQKFQDADIYYSYEYGSLFTKIERGKLLAAYYEDENGKVFYPFIKREAEWENEKFFDIVTPYGYGGPLLAGSVKTLASFYEHFHIFCKVHKIITETIRFHPLSRNYEACREIMAVDYIRKTAAVDLTLPMGEIQKRYTQMNKRNIKKARSVGLFCYEAEKTEKNIHIFIDLYKETMDRNQADSYYYFDDDYFLEQMKNSKTGETFLLFAEYNGEVIAGVIVLKGPVYSHYHLGASRTSWLYLKPNNLLFDFMIEFCQLQGSELLHLGGGYQEGDGLFHFKSSFAHENHYDYFLGKKIHDETKYNQIREKIQQSFAVNENYFPVYRGVKKWRELLYHGGNRLEKND